MAVGSRTSSTSICNPNPKPYTLNPKRGSRFAHLVNIDFFSDLLQAIKSLIAFRPDQACQGDSVLSVASSLHCVVCAFRCLKNQGQVALKLNLRR